MSEVKKTELLENAAAQAITKLSEFLGNTKDFVVEQTPELAQQILAYGVAKAVFMISLFFVVAFVSYKGTFKWSNQNLDIIGGWASTKFSSALIGSIFSAMLFVIALLEFMSLIKIIFAPKLYLLEYIANFIK